MAVVQKRQAENAKDAAQYMSIDLFFFIALTIVCVRTEKKTIM